MAFKSKIKVDQLQELTQTDYIKLLKKEVARAAEFGETGVVILSDFKFKCCTVGTMMILGKMSGPLLKYYKQIKKERSKEKDFAKGVCYFENNEGENSKMRIALNDGKGKPDKMKRNGKSLFKKLGFETEIFKGEVDLTQEEVDTLEDIREQVDEENDDQKIKKIIKNYKKSFATVVKNVVPLLKENPNGEGITEKHYQVVLQLLRLSQSVQDKFEEVGESLKKKDTIEVFVNDVKSREGNLMKMASKLKKLLKSTIETDVEKEEEKLSKEELGTTKTPLSKDRHAELKSKLISLRERLNTLSA